MQRGPHNRKLTRLTLRYLWPNSTGTRGPYGSQTFSYICNRGMFFIVSLLQCQLISFPRKIYIDQDKSLNSKEIMIEGQKAEFNSKKFLFGFMTQLLFHSLSLTCQISQHGRN